MGWWPTQVTDALIRSANADSARRAGATEHALAAIVRVWEDEPSCAWQVKEGAPPLHIGDALIETLTPLDATVAHQAKVATPDMNELSTALRFTWRGTQLLLGGDLVNRRGWDSLNSSFGPHGLASTAGMKIAHHGSTKAQHAVALGPPPATDRVYLGTPFRSGHGVPGYGDGEDVHGLLQVANRVLMSAHLGPRPTGADCMDLPRASLIGPTRSIGTMSVTPALPSAPIHDCWVAGRWRDNGTLVSTQRGPGSVAVVA